MKRHTSERKELQRGIEQFARYIVGNPATKELMDQENKSTIVVQVQYELLECENKEKRWFPVGNGWSYDFENFKPFGKPKLPADVKRIQANKKKSLTPKTKQNGNK